MAVDWKKVACVLAGMVAVHQGKKIELVIEETVSAAEEIDSEP